MIFNDSKSISIIDNRKGLKNFGFEVSETKAILKHNVFFNSIFTVITVNFPTKTTQIDMVDANGDIYMPFYSNFYGVIDTVADTIMNNFNELIMILEGENLIWR